MPQWLKEIIWGKGASGSLLAAGGVAAGSLLRSKSGRSRWRGNMAKWQAPVDRRLFRPGRQLPHRLEIWGDGARYEILRVRVAWPGSAHGAFAKCNRSFCHHDANSTCLFHDIVPRCPAGGGAVSGRLASAQDRHHAVRDCRLRMATQRGDACADEAYLIRDRRAPFAAGGRVSWRDGA